MGEGPARNEGQGGARDRILSPGGAGLVLVPHMPLLGLPWEQEPVLGVLAPPRPGSGLILVTAGLGHLSTDDVPGSRVGSPSASSQARRL